MSSANAAVTLEPVSFARIARGVWASYKAARVLQARRARLRAELTQCSDRDLAEIGLSRADIEHVVAGVRMV